MIRAAATRLAPLAALLASVLASTIQPRPVAAQDSVSRGEAARPTPRDTALERLTRSVAAQLRCPVCQGLSLADSPSELALEMKDVVRDQLAAGRTPEEVKAYFVAKYGEWILLEPPRRGVGLLAYALPAMALAAGLCVVWLALRRWTPNAAASGDLPAAASGDADHEPR